MGKNVQNVRVWVPSKRCYNCTFLAGIVHCFPSVFVRLRQFCSSPLDQMAAPDMYWNEATAFPASLKCELLQLRVWFFQCPNGYELPNTVLSAKTISEPSPFCKNALLLFLWLEVCFGHTEIPRPLSWFMEAYQTFLHNGAVGFVTTERVRLIILSRQNFAWPEFLGTYTLRLARKILSTRSSLPMITCAFLTPLRGLHVRAPHSKQRAGRFKKRALLSWVSKSCSIHNVQKFAVAVKNFSAPANRKILRPYSN